MKKIFLTLCLITASIVTFAQIPSVGIKGGVNFATASVSFDAPSVYNPSRGTVTTFNAGVFVDLKFGNISLQPALNFTGKGNSYTINGLTATDDNGNPLGSTNLVSKETLYYLQLPVNLVYHVPVIIGDLYFGAGPYAAEGITGTIKTTSTNTALEPNSSSTVKFGSSVEDVKPTQFGADAIIGFKLKGGLLINVNYDLALSNDVNSGGGGSSKSRVFGVAIGYVFL
jgi:hypothetical protein